MAWTEEEPIASIKLPNQHIKSVGKKYIFWGGGGMEVIVDRIYLVRERPDSIKFGVSLSEHNDMFSRP
jgi:hypothetical protein